MTFARIGHTEHASVVRLPDGRVGVLEKMRRRPRVVVSDRLAVEVDRHDKVEVLLAPIGLAVHWLEMGGAEKLAAERPPKLPAIFILDDGGEAEGEVLPFCSTTCLDAYEEPRRHWRGDTGGEEVGPGAICIGCRTPLDKEKK